MRSTLFFLSLVPACVFASSGPSSRSTFVGNGFIRKSITAFKHNLSGAVDLTRRQNVVGLGKEREGTLYTIELSIGTPGEKVLVQIDTGSDELWVNPVCSTASQPTYCAKFPRFALSDTLVDLHKTGTIQYGKGKVNLKYMADYVAVGCKSPA
jgi:hypothetical protein